jgi:hypothetical protein
MGLTNVRVTRILEMHTIARWLVVCRSAQTVQGEEGIGREEPRGATSGILRLIRTGLTLRSWAQGQRVRKKWVCQGRLGPGWMSTVRANGDRLGVLQVPH